MGIELTDLRLELSGDLDLRGFLGLDDTVRPGYESMTCTAHVSAGASEDELAELWERVEATSPAMAMLTTEAPLEIHFSIE